MKVSKKNVLFQTCIDGLVHSKNVHFCGRRRYDPQHRLCCNGRLYAKRAGQKCCGFHVYDPLHNTCCYGHLQAGPENMHR